MTDDTAKAILAWTVEADQAAHPAYENPTYIADLQAMARLWLMRDEICSHLDPHDPVRTDIEKLAAIGGE